MNSRTQPPETAGVWRATLRLLLGVLSWMVLLKPTTAAENRLPTRSSRPYLVALGASPLRIQAAPPPADLSVRPPAGAPPIPAAHAPVDPATAPHSSPLENAPNGEALPESTPAATPVTPVADDKAGKNSKPILPDDTRPKVRAEDFLPFFQPPGANPNPNDVTVAPPPAEPGTPTPSSATYRQQ